MGDARNLYWPDTEQRLVACEKFTSPDRSGILFFLAFKKKIERSAGIAPPKPTNDFSGIKNVSLNNLKK